MGMTRLPKDLKQALTSPVTIVSWGLLSSVVAFSGPFGTYDTASLSTRLLYWSAVVAVAIFGSQIVRVFVRRWLGTEVFWKPALITAGIMALLLAQPLRMVSLKIAGNMSGLVPPFHEVVFMVFICGMGMGALRTLLVEPPLPSPPAKDAPLPAAQAAGDAPPAPALPAPAAEPAPRLLNRLEPGLRGEVIRLEVDDHYVMVITDQGVSKLLMRMGDAIEALEGTNGMRVHRSHWVSFDAVTGHEVEKGRLFLIMADGSRVPVSRSQRPEVSDRMSA